MCSIFRHRINYSGPDNSNTLSNDISEDGSNSNGNVPSIMSLKPDSQTTAHNKNGGLFNSESKRSHCIDAHEMNDLDGESCGGVTCASALDLSILPNSMSNAKGNVSLEIFQPTKMAVAQFAANALANVQCFDESRPELIAFLNAQRQHFLQLQLIQHLQSQLKHRELENLRQTQIDEQETEHLDLTDGKNISTDSDELSVSQRKEFLTDSNVENEIENEPSNGTVINLTNFNKTRNDEKSDAKKTSSKESSEDFKNNTLTDESTSKRYQPVLCDISSTLASSIITNHDPPPAPNEPNCLEVLQRRTEEVLDSASQSLHASQLQDEYEYNCKDGQGRGEIFKHRCRYCGKIFGSFSALQIHLRSHTGERPFQCNVCGSKFTTKGNLKVHYQRHTQIYPPLLFPPVVCSPLPTATESTELPNAVSAGGIRLQYNIEQTIQSASGSSINNIESNENNLRIKVYDKEEFNSDLHCQPVTPPNNLQTQEDPEDLSKSTTDTEIRNQKPQPFVSVKTPQLLMESNIQESTVHDKYDRTTMIHSLKRNNSYRIRNLIATASSDDQDDNNLIEELHGTKMYRPSTQSVLSSNSFEHLPSDFSQIENFVDKSWEDLIEIDTTSETSKLQQLVDNIENKLTDPNQCIFCQKIMSCRSSLQMHIRTHTGERPFRCKICGRAFATKGNLKAHMSIHKIKPPMRSQFKCPVCHQKFSNGIILQQHIRIHTIDDNINPPGTSGCGSVELAGAISEHGHRLRSHMESTVLEDQNSNKSICASDNFDFSTTSDYSGQRSESSQDDFDDCVTIEGTDDSRENTVTLKQYDKQGAPGMDNDKNRSESNEPRIEAIDLSARGNGSNGGNSNSSGNSGKILPNLFTLPANFWFMAAAQEDIQGHLPFLPFAPLGLIGLQSSTPFCQLCFKFFPSSAALEMHVKAEHRNHQQQIHETDILDDSSGLITNTRAMPTTNNRDTPATETTTITPLPTTIATTTILTATSTTTANLTSLSTSTLNQFTATSTTPPISPTPMTFATAKTTSCTSLTSLPPSETPTSILNHKNLEVLAPNVCNINSTDNDTNGLPAPLTNKKGVDEMLKNNSLIEATKLKIYENSGENQLQENEKQDQTESKQHLEGQHITVNQTVIKEEPVCEEIYEVTSEDAPKVTTDGFPSKFYENYDEDLCNKSKGYDGGEIMASNTNTTSAECDEELTTNQLSPNFMRTYPCHQIDQLPDAAEHSLMKMQMLIAIPHQMYNSFISMEGQRFPATPLNFQQALLSVGPPVSSMDLPLNNKHYCHICRRNFSSSSALQIHMRTHTGDKPFQCNVCQKAFTTKGNLKVHMGTHMWSNSTSRRGRRMSLELPLHRSSTSMACENEFLQRHPDVYFPYLPPFFNGLPPKQNDLSCNTFSTISPRQHVDSNYHKVNKYPPNLTTITFPPFLTSPYKHDAQFNHSYAERQLNYKTPPPIIDTPTLLAASPAAAMATTTSSPKLTALPATMANDDNEIKTPAQNLNLPSNGCNDLSQPGVYIKSENHTNVNSHMENTEGNDLNNNN